MQGKVHMERRPTSGAAAPSLLWREIVEDPLNEAALSHYRLAAAEPRTLFEAIGDDLSHSDEEVRARGFLALQIAMPELAEILYEKESRRYGWRRDEGSGQRLVNDGMDILTQLYLVLVKDRGYDSGKRADPSGLVRTAAKNWKIDEFRHKNKARETTLDRPGSLEGQLTIATPSAENVVIERLADHESCKELVTWGLIDPDKELPLMYALYVDGRPLQEVAESLEIRPDALRKRISRIRRKFVLRRDSALAYFLRLPVYGNSTWDREARDSIVESEWWSRAAAAIRPTQPLELDSELQPDARLHASVTPLTSEFGGDPGYLFLFGLDGSLATQFFGNESEIPQRWYRRASIGNLLPLAYPTDDRGQRVRKFMDELMFCFEGRTLALEQFARFDGQQSGISQLDRYLRQVEKENRIPIVASTLRRDEVWDTVRPIHEALGHLSAAKTTSLTGGRLD
jgi:DNA-directed RNA polymerase specialized sigma24 family protein